MYWWPELNLSQSVEHLLADQLVCWGNVLAGAEPPVDLTEKMKAASNLTGAFTATECNKLADKLSAERKNRT